jgi:MFS family permease
MAGSVISVLGQQMLAVVVAWDLYVATRSPLVLGNVGLVQIVPVLLFSLWAGHIADRYNRQRIAVVAQIFSTLVGVVLTFSGGYRGVALIYSCLFVIGLARSFQWPVTSALLPTVVSREELSQAVSWSASARETATIIGPGVAGLILGASGSTAVYAVQAAMALISLLCYLALRLPPQVAPETTESSAKAILDGLRFVWNEKLVLYAITLDLLAVLLGGAIALLPIYAEDILQIGAKGLGWLRAAPAVGAALMGVYLAYRGTIRHAGSALLLSVAGFGIATIGFGISTNAWISFLMLFLTGLMDQVSVVLRTYLVQIRTPNHLLGRVMSVNALFISSSNQWGAVESGVAAAWLGVVPAVAWGGVATIIVVIFVAYASKELRRWKT